MEKQWVARHHIAIPGQRVLSPGEVVPGDLICALEDAQLERLLQKGALQVLGGDDPESGDLPAPLRPDDEEEAAPRTPDAEENGITGGNPEEADEAGDAEQGPIAMDAAAAIVDSPQKAGAGKDAPARREKSEKGGGTDGA